jgi:hypothetical protein
MTIMHSTTTQESQTQYLGSKILAQFQNVSLVLFRFVGVRILRTIVSRFIAWRMVLFALRLIRFVVLLVIRIVGIRIRVISVLLVRIVLVVLSVRVVIVSRTITVVGRLVGVGISRFIAVRIRRTRLQNCCPLDGYCCSLADDCGSDCGFCGLYLPTKTNLRAPPNLRVSTRQ